MAYIQVEASVRTHRKFLKAGPAASWLWLCGVGYCQDGLTDGFIPYEAIDFLGIKGATARKLKVTLVAVGLWDEVPGGWMVHDYLKSNKSAAAVAEVKAKRGSGGNLGGRPKKPSDETFKVSETETLPETLPETFSEKSRESRDVAVDVVALERGLGKTADPPPMDVWFQRLLTEYPSNRAQRNQRTESVFVQQLLGFKDGPEVAWGVLLANLDANRNSHEWRVKGMIPWLYRYLEEGLWLNALPADPPAAEQLSARTMRMLG